MDNTMIPIIVTIGISTLIIVASILGTFFILLNHLSGRIDKANSELGGRIERSESRITQAAAKDKAELLETIRDTEQRLTETMRSDKAELQETIRDTEQRLSRRLDRFEDKTDANFEALRRESSERPAEQPVAGDD